MDIECPVVYNYGTKLATKVFIYRKIIHPCYRPLNLVYAQGPFPVLSFNTVAMLMYAVRLPTIQQMLSSLG